MEQNEPTETDLNKIAIDLMQNIGQGKKRFVADFVHKKADAKELYAENGDRFNLFDPDNPKVEAVSIYLRDMLINKIFPAFMKSETLKSDVDPNELEVVIYNDTESAAARYCNSNVVGINLSTLITAYYNNSEDILAQCLAHELLHRHWSQFSNNKLQEGAAQFKSVAALHYAGYAPATAIREHDFPENIGIDVYQDEHLADHNNNRAVDIALTLLRSKVGDLKDTKTHISEDNRNELSDLIQEVKTGKLSAQSRLHKFVKSPHDDVCARLEDVLNFLQNTTEISAEDMSQLENIISSLKLDKKNPEHRTAMLQLMDHLTTYNGRQIPEMEKFYLNSLGSDFFERQIPEDSNLGKLLKAYKDFADAENYESTKSSADEIVRLTKRTTDNLNQENILNIIKGVNFFPDSYLGEKDLIKFKISQSEIESAEIKNVFSGEFKTPFSLPWQKHLQFAQKEVIDTDEEHIGKIIKVLFNDNFYNNNSYQKFYIKINEELELYNFKRNDDGTINSTKNNEYKKQHQTNDWANFEKAISDEQRLLQDRKEYEIRMIAKVNWDDFLENPRQFIEEYKELLSPHIGICHDQQPFIEKFIQSIEQLDEEKKANFLEYFLSNYSGNTGYLINLFRDAHYEYNDSIYCRYLLDDNRNQLILGIGVQEDHPYIKLANQYALKPSDKSLISSYIKPFNSMSANKYIYPEDFTNSEHLLAFKDYALINKMPSYAKFYYALNIVQDIHKQDITPDITIEDLLHIKE